MPLQLFDMAKHQKLLKRRNFLISLGALAAIGSGIGWRRLKSYTQGLAVDNPMRNFHVANDLPLRRRVTTKGLIYGAYTETDHKVFSQNKTLQSSFVQECGLILGGFYWGIIRPNATDFDFSQTDYFANFASENGMLFRGHPLIWHDFPPDWLNEKFKSAKTTPREIRDIFTTHISTVVKRYAGRMHSWDVVNEVVHLDDGRRDGLRTSPWLKFVGPDYIELAFKTAASADPNALLVYNENYLEYDTREYDAKRDAVLKLLEHLKSKRTPVHALGIQSHLLAHETRFHPNKLRRFLADVASLGLKIMITELDVIDAELPADIKVRDRIVASTYEDYLSVVLDEPAVIAVITWGLSDKYTWLSEAAPRPDGRAVRPLPLDSNFERKLAWNAIARAFDNAPKR